MFSWCWWSHRWQTLCFSPRYCETSQTKHHNFWSGLWWSMPSWSKAWYFGFQNRGTGPSLIPSLSRLLCYGVPSHQSHNFSQDNSPLQQQGGHLKVVYYSFQKRKMTFLKLTFKANRSFHLGHLLLQLSKEMVLPSLSWKRNMRSLGNIKYNRQNARRGFFSKSSCATLPQFVRIWKVAINKQLGKKKEILWGRIFANKENVEFSLFWEFLKISPTVFANILSTGETYYYDLFLNFLLWVIKSVLQYTGVKKLICNFFATSFVSKTEHACNLSACWNNDAIWRMR